MRNTVEVTANESDPNTANNRASRCKLSALIDPAADGYRDGVLTIVDESDPIVASVGDDVGG